MTSLFVWLTVWAITAPIAYVLVRRSFRSDSGKWTQADRIFWASFCLLYGPIMLAIVIIGGLVRKIGDTDWAKREVQW